MLKGWTTGRLFSWLKWSEGRTKTYVAQRYEPILRFNTTPVYDVTLDADTAATSANPYIVPSAVFDGTFSMANLKLYTPAVTTTNALRVRVSWGNVSYEGQCNNGLSTSARYVLCKIRKDYGMADMLFSVGSGTNAAPLYSGDSSDFPVVVGASAMSGISVWAFGGVRLPAGTRITIYAAKEAE